MSNTPIFPESIYQGEQHPIPKIDLDILSHENIGEGVTRVLCKANGLPAKRLTQCIYGAYVNEIPVWSIDDRIVANWFTELLEKEYQNQTSGKTIVIK